MLSSLLHIAGGFALLAAGSHFLVRGATAMALWLRVRPAVIGITIVALGTSLPELFVSWAAHVDGFPNMAVGNIIGSNLLNIALVLGLSSLFLPIPIDRSSIRFEWPAMMIVVLLFAGFGMNHQIDRLEGILLLASMAGAMGLFIYLGLEGKTSSIKVETDEALELRAKISGSQKGLFLSLYGLELIAGFILLKVGSDVFIKGAVQFADRMGLTERFIGLTVAAIGTSLPELAVSLMATYKGRSDVAIGNILGSNIFNIGGVLGACAVHHPIVFSASTLTLDIPWLVGISFLLLLCMLKRRIDRPRGGVLLAAYAAYISLIL